jgi:hypothetical protein
MIKNFKIFEDSKNIKPLDYVIFGYTEDTKLKNFLNNTIGKVGERINDIMVSVEYTNIPDDDIKGYFCYVRGIYNIFLSKKYVAYTSTNKEDCEAFINSKKYNI